jgi:hypothetical protein
MNNLLLLAYGIRRLRFGHFSSLFIRIHVYRRISDMVQIQGNKMERKGKERKGKEREFLPSP